MAPDVYLTEASENLYRDAVIQAVPEAVIRRLGPDGRTQSAATGEGVLLVSYDLFIAHRELPVIADHLSEVAKRCAWVQAGSAGADDPLLERIRAVSSRYCNASGLHAIPISQYVFAQLLRHYRRVDLHAEQQQERRWQPFMMEEPTGKTLGILGYGGIGRETARLGRAFGMQVLGWRRNAKPDEFAHSVLCGEDGLKEVLERSDCLVCCLPHSEETAGLLNSDRLSSLKPGVVLVNVGRGSVLDESALVRLLTEGRIAFAALDTTVQEPLDRNSPLWDAPNCHITPHDSAWSPLAAARLGELFCDNLKRWVNQKPLRNEEPAVHSL